MRSKLVRQTLLGFVAALWLLPLAVPGVSAGEMQFQVHLVWATDDPKPPQGKDYKPLEPEIRKQVKALKWKNYFEVRHIDFALLPGTNKQVSISDKCSIEIKDLGNSNVEVVLFGKGKEVARVKQALRKGEILVPAGDAPNETAWLAILQRVQ
jgi:hypothetical protein